ncbi:hypothetical protein [Saccharothrix syringae]|uniref:Uncharacterized protein n=1 Tax=Saccharothrix syringae TaxID=103733 RepID=A0A5Q0GZ54_SACSY|nr:hypothetical protein [Saccharothrix syringae]QFZ18662.1 hypothetical protein EKG83_15380 [Saccharothrix syringae]
MSRSFVRPRFLFGQVLAEEDLNTLTAYAHDKSLRAARRHAWGVVEGLEVSGTGSNQVTITAGSAVTARGDDIVVTGSVPFTVPNVKVCDLGLKHREKGERPVSGAEQRPVDPCGKVERQEEGDRHSRIVEYYEPIALDPAKADQDPDVVPLARLTRSNNGIEVNPLIRRYFGAEVRHDPEGKLLLDRIIGIDVLEATALLTRWGVVVSEWTEGDDVGHRVPPTARRGELVRLVSDRKTRRVLRIESCEVWT